MLETELNNLSQKHKLELANMSQSLKSDFEHQLSLIKSEAQSQRWTELVELQTQIQEKNKQNEELRK